jgi:acetylornithine deacetylase/succinyl-diaminopimelate desuccinylase-like protein
VLKLREAARSRESTTANVGKISVEPGGANVVPGLAEFTIDVRAATPEAIAEWERTVDEVVRRVAAEERLDADVEQTFALEPLELEPALVDTVERAAVAVGASATRLPSGAGHDAMVVGRHVPAAMIFVPSRRGVSHSSDEFTEPDDVEVGMRVLAETLRLSLRSK